MTGFRNKVPITGRSGPTPNRLSWTPQEGRLPMRHVVSGHRSGGVVALIIGLPWLFYSARFLSGEVERTGLGFGQAFLFLVVLGGLFVTLFGLSQFIYREELVIDGATVRRTRRGVTGISRWQEPLSHYRGVLKESHYCSGSDAEDLRPHPAYLEYTLTLHHDDSSRRVRLYESQNSMLYPPEEWNRLWTHYAKLFGLPVLEGGREGIAAYALADLTRPLRDKIAEGKIQISELNLERPDLPIGLSLHREEDLWVLTLKPMGYARNVAWLFAMALAVLSLGFLLADSVGALLLMLAFGVALLAGAAYFADSLVRELRHADQVAVDANRLWYRTWKRRGGWDTRSVSIAEIVDIALRTEPAYDGRGEQVMVEGKNGQLAFGAALTDRARRRLRDVLLFLIGRSMPDKSGTS